MPVVAQLGTVRDQDKDGEWQEVRQKANTAALDKEGQRGQVKQCGQLVAKNKLRASY